MALVRAWRRTPLWLRLISATLALVALGLTLTGVLGVRLLRTYLVDQVDDELRGAAAEAHRRVQEMETGDPPAPLVPSQFTLTVLDREGTSRVSVRSELSPTEPDVPELAFPEALARAG